MTCDLLALLDDYLDNTLNSTDRLRLQGHLAVCPYCARELRERHAFETGVKQALAASVQQLHLSSAASRNIWNAVDGQVQKPSATYQLLRLAPMAAGMAVVALLLMGLFLFLAQVPLFLGLERIALPSLNRLSAVERGDLLVEPRQIHPGDLFTVTVPLEGDPFPTGTVIHCTLDISGPSGHYRFVFTMPRLSVVPGRSELRLTPSSLASISQEQYHISPAQILSVPGVYRFRLTLLGQGAAPGQ